MNNIQQFDFHHVFVGSYAMGIFPHRDVDVVCYEKSLPANVKSSDGYIAVSIIDGVKYEFLLADKAEYLQYLLSYYDTGQKVSLRHLWVLKASHLHIPNPKWQKHLNDYLILSKMTEHERYPQTQDLLEIAIKDTDRRLTPHKMKLKNVSKEQFFDDAVKKYHDHDYLHEQLAIENVPAYTYMQKDDGSVMCHKDLWENMTYQQKLNCATEESMVIGLERWIVPAMETNTRIPPTLQSFKKGVEKLCTTLSSGWFRTFCHVHYKEIVNNFKPNLIEQFKTKHYGN